MTPHIPLKAGGGGCREGGESVLGILSKYLDNNVLYNAKKNRKTFQSKSQITRKTTVITRAEKRRRRTPAAWHWKNALSFGNSPVEAVAQKSTAQYVQCFFQTSIYGSNKKPPRKELDAKMKQRKTWPQHFDK